MNFIAKFGLNIHKLDFGIIWVKIWIKFYNKYTFLMFLVKVRYKNLNKDFKEVQVKPREYLLSQVNTSLAK